MTAPLKKFLDSLNETDYKGSETKKSIQVKAKYFLGSYHYQEFEEYNGFEIHNLLLCLIHNNI